MPRELNFEQRSPEWYEARLGKWSGSDFHTMLGKSQTKIDFMWEKLAERMYGDSDKEDFTTFYMERGIILEAEARRVYSAVTETDVREVGLVEEDGEFDGYAVCSPDGMVDPDGIVEIKCLSAKYIIQYTTKDSPKYGYIKPEYRTQVQYNLFITGRQWCDFVYYHPRLGITIIRIQRDEEYIERIKEALREGVTFLKEHLPEK